MVPKAFVAASGVG